MRDAHAPGFLGPVLLTDVHSPCDFGLSLCPEPMFLHMQNGVEINIFTTYSIELFLTAK